MRNAFSYIQWKIAMDRMQDANINSQIEVNDLCIGVQDTGPGLSPETLSRLFEPFYTTKPNGMGMGLAICRWIIEAHGGRLRATACQPHGAFFQFTIPTQPA
jgi:signal transduction histidine kinase